MPRTAPVTTPIERIAYTLDEAASAANVSERTIRRAIQKRELPVCRLGVKRCTRVRVVDLVKWVDRHTSRVTRREDEV